MSSKNNYDYWKNPEKPYPLQLNWVVVAGERRLSVLEDHDIIFDEYDLKIRRMVLDDVDSIKKAKKYEKQQNG